MLVIRRDLVDEIVAHARAEHPHEACGLIAGPEGAERPERVIRMVNAAKPTDDERARRGSAPTATSCSASTASTG